MAAINLLQNGSLDEHFVAYRGNDAVQVVAGWAPWWTPQREDQPSWQNQKPDYQPVTFDGQRAQGIASPWGTHLGGLYQQVPAAPGDRYRLQAEAHGWSSEGETPGSQQDPGDLNVQVGLDPTGGLDPGSPLITWHQPVQPLRRWERLALEVTAETPILTVYLKSAPNLPKRQNAVFWRQAQLAPLSALRRHVTIVGPGDTYLRFAPEAPRPGDTVVVTASSLRDHVFVSLLVQHPSTIWTSYAAFEEGRDGERYVWRFRFRLHDDGLHDVRFVGDLGARLLAEHLLRVAFAEAGAEPAGARRGQPRQPYRRVYVLLPPTADARWATAAARGGFEGRFTVGYSADDAGIGDLDSRHVLAVNPHHWPEMLTAAWFEQHYPGVRFTPVVVNAPADLEAWLSSWVAETI